MTLAKPIPGFSVGLRAAVEAISHVGWLFDGLRYCLEGGFRAHHAMLGEELANIDGPVLDCGCGTGAMAECFDAREYLGIDCSSNYIARARSRHGRHRFMTMDATALKLPANSFQKVIVCGVLHHLDDTTASRMIREIHRVLVPGGTFLVWEDVPTRSRFNLIGRMVHALDVGEHIRSEPAYVQLLNEHFDVTDRKPLLSGWMDYTLFRCQKRSLVTSATHDGFESLAVSAGLGASSMLVPT